MIQPQNPEQANESLTGPDVGTLRNDILRDLMAVCLSLGDIDSVVAYDHSAEPLVVRQEVLMTTIRSLLADGLVVVGAVNGGTDATVDPWDLSLEESMARLHDRYVVHYDTWETWGWTTWFALTELGTRTAEAT